MQHAKFIPFFIKIAKLFNEKLIVFYNNLINYIGKLTL